MKNSICTSLLFTINREKSRFIYCMIRRLFFFFLLSGVLLAACTDDDSFTTATGNKLIFSEDTIRFDTLFSAVPSATQSFWVRNQSGDGIRIRTARLERSNQSGYRVNVDGTFLDPVGNNFEVRDGDSILVFVEVTTRENNAKGLHLVEDNIVFTLESGVEQRVNLRTFSWDALKMNSLVVSRDTTIESDIPLLFYGNGITVAPNVTLNLRNTELYFHDGAGIRVEGNIVAEDCLFRGDRLDRMFSYLPYDRVSGQWQGFTLRPSSNNTFVNCEIRNAVDAVLCDSATLSMTNCVLHNSSGEGLSVHNSEVQLNYCQFSNTYGDCLSLEGCIARIDHCTLAQFYPFSGMRGAALRFTNSDMPLDFNCSYTLVTGYADDVVMGGQSDETTGYEFRFDHCLLRTPEMKDDGRFEEIIWETPEDTIQGKQHFVVFDEDNLFYDFAIDTISPAYPRNIGRY